MYRVDSRYIVREDDSRYDFHLVVQNGRQVTAQFDTWEDADQWIRDNINKHDNPKLLTIELANICQHFVLKGWSYVRNNKQSITLSSRKMHENGLRYRVRVSHYALHNDDYGIVIGSGDEIERIEKQYEEFMIS